MTEFKIADEDSLVVTLGMSDISIEIPMARSLELLVQGPFSLEIELAIDKLLAKTPLSESSTYLVINRITVEPVLKTEIVAATGATTVKLAHNNTTSDDAFAIGMALNDADTGEKVDILIMGVINDPIFTAFPLNSTVFLDTDGGTTDVRPIRPSATSSTIIGRSFGNGEVFVNVQRPVFL